jgi:YVTN family beta-propeller protein
VYVAHLIDSGDPETVYTGAISVIDTLNNTIIGTLPIAVFIPGNIALNPQGNRLYIPDGAFNSVVVIDPIGLHVITTIVAIPPYTMNPAGSELCPNSDFAVT